MLWVLQKILRFIGYCWMHLEQGNMFFGREEKNTENYLLPLFSYENRSCRNAIWCNRKKLEKEAKNKYNYFMGCQLKSKKLSFALIFWVICLHIWLKNRKIQSRIDYKTFMNEKDIQKTFLLQILPYISRKSIQFWTFILIWTWNKLKKNCTTSILTNDFNEFHDKVLVVDVLLSL